MCVEGWIKEWWGKMTYVQVQENNGSDFLESDY